MPTASGSASRRKYGVSRSRGLSRRLGGSRKGLPVLAAAVVAVVPLAVRVLLAVSVAARVLVAVPVAVRMLVAASVRGVPRLRLVGVAGGGTGRLLFRRLPFL